MDNDFRDLVYLYSEQDHYDIVELLREIEQQEADQEQTSAEFLKVYGFDPYNDHFSKALPYIKEKVCG